MQHNIAKQQAAQQQSAMDAQTKRDAEAKAKSDAIGTAAKQMTINPLPTAEEEKKKQLALQNGIMGTIKSSPGTAGSLVSAPTELKKATLGA
jgi:hypothetical protein